MVEMNLLMVALLKFKIKFMKSRYKILGGIAASAILVLQSLAFQASAATPLVVNFEKTPLFGESNIAPGHSVTRFIKLLNSSGTTKKIIIEAINYAKPIPGKDLSRALVIKINQGEKTIYEPKSLNEFYSAGEIYLSDAPSGTEIQYDLTISFPTDRGDEWRGRTTGFDILIGFKGEEGGKSDGGSILAVNGGGGGGNGSPLGLSILDESLQITDIGTTEVTISWTTSYFSTSQVLYATEGESHALDLTDTAGSPPKYGYARTTPEYTEKVTSHSVAITGLAPGTTYYVRAVSHGSLAISPQISFSTLEKTKEPVFEIEEQALSQNIQASQTPSAGIVAGASTGPDVNPIVSEEKNIIREISQLNQGAATQNEASNNLFASIGFTGGRKQISIMLLIVFIIIIALILLKIAGRKKKNQNSPNSNKDFSV